MMPLQVYDMVLTAKSPLFVGSGKELMKKEYLYNSRNKSVTVIDHIKLMEYLVYRGTPDMLDKYESFMLENNANLLDFLNDTIRLNAAERRKISLYETNAGAALSETHSLRNIKMFMRNAKNKPYIPGSSVKGALRTAILVKMINDGNAVPSVNDSNLEANYLHTLNRTAQKNNALNSVMSGVSISDSLPLENSDMVLAGKLDVFKDGGRNRLNVVRECVKPGTAVKFKLVIKPELCGDVNAEYIVAAVREFGIYYKNTFSSKFDGLADAPSETFADCILLGGGAGYFSKNIVYPKRSWEEGVRIVSEKMTSKFRIHHHERDIREGISPRALKYTKCKADVSNSEVIRQFGVCSVSIKSESKS